ncbi:MAG: SDR family oxidoreductase [Actinobacteria bacterium]|nr:SDR family oxidoreductase [Actinomycetota bacterium]
MSAKPLAAQRLKDKVAIITGGGGTNSIGRAISLRFAAEGAKVAVLDINVAGAEKVAEEIQAAGGIAIAVGCDITDLAQAEAAVKKVADAFGSRIEILVNNAAFFGTMGEWRPFDQWTPEEWDHMLAVNVRGMWFCARAVVPYMKAQKYGKIINLSSSTFYQGVPGFIHYTTSKGGVIGFTNSLGKELGEFGIRVNALAPGFTVSNAQIALTKDYPDWWVHSREGQALKERNELPEDLAGPAFFLASEDSDFMSCQTLLVDGGYSPH